MHSPHYVLLQITLNIKEMKNLCIIIMLICLHTYLDTHTYIVTIIHYIPRDVRDNNNLLMYQGLMEFIVFAFFLYTQKLSFV